MNSEHLALCASDGWARQLGARLVPWALAAAPERVATLVELGPGPGAATEILRGRTDRLIAAEFDPDLAAGLRARMAADPSVTVLNTDATRLPLAAGSVDLVAAFTMLHHLPDAEAQDAAFEGAARVLRPGGVFIGTDSLDSPGLRRLHRGDILVPIDPLTLASRLERAGFVDVEIEVLAYGLRFAARTG